VYLVFSANKSGEYFGYARMASAIADDEVLALEVPPRPEKPSSEAGDLDVIPTEATTTAPKGRIIDDSARGTIFWEADSSEDDGNSNEEEDDGDDDSENANNGGGDGEDDSDGEDGIEDDTAQSEKSTAELGGEDGGSGSQTLGKPFRIEWVSTERVPFYRTRGLRNPWNSNREVKIARDGTEIEPSVGRKLTQLFHVTSSVISPGPGYQRSY
jgi:YT521-B-like domain